MERSPSSASKISGILNQEINHRLRPRFWILILGFLAVTTITVGVLGWQLTFTTSQKNTAVLVDETEDIIADSIMHTILSDADVLQTLTATQASMLEKTNRTMRAMLVLLNRVRQFTTSMYYNTYPGGLQFGYNYPSPSSNQLQLWTQAPNNTQYTWNCNPQGSPVGEPISVLYRPGNNTLENPGTNETLRLGINGIDGINIDYANSTFQTFSPIYAYNGQVYITSYRVAINRETQEKVVFANDWTVSYIFERIQDVTSVIPYPMFVGIIEVSSGNLMVASNNVSLLADDGQSLTPIYLINDPFIHDFLTYVNETFAPTFSPVQNLPSQLSIVPAAIDSTPTEAIYITRKISGVNWRLELNYFTLGIQQYILFTYLNIDAQAQVQAVSQQTGIYIFVIIGVSLLLGTLFALAVSRQLNIVSQQINLLKQLKFSEVLGVESGVKRRSFIKELAELQQGFHEMCKVFATMIKANSMLQKGPHVSGHTGNYSLPRRPISSSAIDLPGRQMTAVESRPATTTEGTIGISKET
ncbi:hypothetical protein BCR33DRAFT_713363 [Rhizoclosmatium globosum]|uniref:Cache domain-containing protein n=1 Tax=Rhizoclosmatium globosum TaxID=329046 RepID=A0A1Y2CRS8_9FUNG|nr:hypothetical protein BCR33DRAFT_713363 [Rhizoclosmatium globosum]|eukprot:ORY49749.1 hypothetical protein BCR33DRAFT_713363 [Rhizoclosmatium globosum]